ncbi:hypothetical protein LINPERPRIM_LOCUS37390 [Linum perenne]
MDLRALLQLRRRFHSHRSQQFPGPDGVLRDSD